jgi:two-component system chemotaxis response regulator CheY
MKLCLVVDESQIVRRVAKVLLNSIGYEVIEAENGQDALDQCKARMPDLILLDWKLPILNAHEFLSIFTRTFTGKKPFIAYATTDFDPTDISRAIAAGADDYILKPFDRSSIEAKFRVLPVAA